MPVKATPFIKLLQSVLQKSIDERLEQIKSILPVLESGAVKATGPLARQFVTVLTSIARSPDTTPEQLAFAAELRQRVDEVFDDPRNPDNKRPTTGNSESKIKSNLAPKVPDGFDSAFLNVEAAIARVLNKYQAPPPYTPLGNERILETFLGDVPLTAESARQFGFTLPRSSRIEAEVAPNHSPQFFHRSSSRFKPRYANS